MRKDIPSPRRKSLRIPKYDYSKPNAYFITICSFQKQLLFGKIQKEQISLNTAGQIVWEVWQSLNNRYPNVELDAFIVMPNHIHGILKVTSDEVGAIHELPLQTVFNVDSPGETVKRRKMLIPKIVGYFKMNSSKRINLARNSPGSRVWQRNYYEHVIRNDRALIRLRNYIDENPFKWSEDPENPQVD